MDQRGKDVTRDDNNREVNVDRVAKQNCNFYSMQTGCLELLKSSQVRKL